MYSLHKCRPNVKVNAKTSPNFMVWRCTVSDKFPANHVKHFGICAFPSNFHTRILGKNLIACAVFLSTFIEYGIKAEVCQKSSDMQTIDSICLKYFKISFSMSYFSSY